MFKSRHYEAIAHAMCNAKHKTRNDALDHSDMIAIDQWEWDCGKLADMFASDNPRFKRATFIVACEKVS